MYAVTRKVLSPSIAKPIATISVVPRIAGPTVRKTYRTASGASIDARAYWYLLRKCTVSSTMIPMDRPATIETAKPTWPTIIAHTPNAINAGSTLGIRLITPRRTLFSAIIRMPAMSANPRPVPSSIEAMLRRVILANISGVPVPRADRMLGVPFRANHASASATSCSTTFTSTSP